MAADLLTSEHEVPPQPVRKQGSACTLLQILEVSDEQTWNWTFCNRWLSLLN